MVGGGIGSYIGAMHRRAIALDGTAELVAGCFSQTREKSLQLAEQLYVEPERVYARLRDDGSSRGCTRKRH